MSELNPIQSISAAAAQPAQPSKPTAKAIATAVDFEAVFLGSMVKTMMETGKPEGGFTGGNAEEMFRGVLAEKLGIEIAKRGGVGLAPMVLEQMVRMQEQKP